MDLTVHCIVFFHLISLYLSTTLSAETNSPHRKGKKWMRHTPLGSVLKTSGSCKFRLQVYDDTIVYDRQVEIHSDELDGLVDPNVAKDRLYLPHNLRIFQHTGHRDCPTEIIIDASALYKLEKIRLSTLPQLPANMDRLHSLKDFHCENIYDAGVDFAIFRNMKQLEVIVVSESYGAAITHPLHLPVLRRLSIIRSPTLLFDSAFCHFPELTSIGLSNNDLPKLPKYFSSFTKLRTVYIVHNKLRSISADLFGTMHQLKDIELTENRIADIVTQNRLELPCLTRLRLDNNYLTTLNFTLWNVPALEFLTLVNNRLITVPGLLKLGDKNSVQMEMYGNPWDCDWLKQMTQEIPGIDVVPLESEPCHAFCENICKIGN